MNPTNAANAPTVPSGEIIWTGGEIDRVDVSLRFFGDDLDPAHITDKLQCEPTVSYRKGDALPGKHHYRAAGTGAWRLQIPNDKAGSLQEKINWLLDKTSSDLADWEDLKRYRHDVFCGLYLKEWNRGCSLSPELMRRLADRDLTLDFDLYCSAEAAE